MGNIKKQTNRQIHTYVIAYRQTHRYKSWENEHQKFKKDLLRRNHVFKHFQLYIDKLCKLKTGTYFLKTLKSIPHIYKNSYDKKLRQDC